MVTVKIKRTPSLSKLEYYKLHFPEYFNVNIDRLRKAVETSYFIAKSIGIDSNMYSKYVHDAQAMEEVIKLRESDNVH